MSEIREKQDNKLLAYRFLFFILGTMFAVFANEARLEIMGISENFVTGIGVIGALNLLNDVAFPLGISIAVLLLLFNQGRWVWVAFLGIFVASLPGFVGMLFPISGFSFILAIPLILILITEVSFAYAAWAFREELGKVFGAES